MMVWHTLGAWDCQDKFSTHCIWFLCRGAIRHDMSFIAIQNPVFVYPAPMEFGK
jgi:hypothetical protein